MSQFEVCSKRLMDVLLLMLTIWLWLPAIAVVALLVRARLGTPVLFVQSRAGLAGRTFLFTKFRSMTEATDSQGRLLPDEQRLTSFSRWLRSTSLDELPSLINVLRGHMSLVGPRPLLPEYLPLYDLRQARRHEVPPGVTGWAQVNGRNAISWEQKFELDVWYVENRSFWLDLRILWITLFRVLKRDGVVQEGHATAERFRGSGSLK